MRRIMRRIKVFDDWKSIIHVLFMAISAYLHVAATAAVLFTGYQLVESIHGLEEPSDTLGDFIEAAVGLIIGAIRV